MVSTRLASVNTVKMKEFRDLQVIALVGVSAISSVACSEKQYFDQPDSFSYLVMQTKIIKRIV